MWLFLFFSFAFATPPGTPAEISAAATDLPFGITEFIASSQAEPGDPVVYTVYYLKEENSARNQKLIIAGIRRASKPSIDTPVAADVRALNSSEIAAAAQIFRHVFKLTPKGFEFQSGEALCGLIRNNISEFSAKTFPDQKVQSRSCPRGQISADAEQLVQLIATAVHDKSRPTLRDSNWSR